MVRDEEVEDAAAPIPVLDKHLHCALEHDVGGGVD
jgi:hypothetical protein